MNYDFEEYQPVDIEDEVFLSELPLDILKSSLTEQFNDPVEYRKKDYIQTFITKYEYSLNNMMEDDLIMVEAYHDKFMGFVKDLFYEKLKIGFVELGDMDEDNQHELIHLTYRFFIKNIKKNFVNLILNYINQNREEIETLYEKKKDVTSNTFKGEITDEYDILVLTNLGDIINSILESVQNESDVESFLKLCEGNGTCLELEYVKHGYNECLITGNFVNDYVDMVNVFFKVELESKLRNKVLKKYPTRAKRALSELDDEEEIDEKNKNGEE